MNIQASPKTVVARAVRQMCPALREEYDSLRRLLASATASDVRARYRVGKIVAGIKVREDRYGARAVPLLAIALGRDETTLYRYATVAETWDESALADLLLLRMPNGEPLSWSHLLELAAVPSPEARERLVQAALTQGLSVRALAALARRGILSLSQASISPSFSRLERLVRMCDLIEKRVSVDDALIDGITSLDMREATSLLSRAVAAQEHALHALESNLKKLKEAESRLLSHSSPQLRVASARRKPESFPFLLAGGRA